MSIDTNLVNIAVYDIDTWMGSGYTTIAVFRATSGSGTYTEVTSGATRSTLASATEYYTYIDTGTNISTYTYKFKYRMANGSVSAFVTDWFRAWSSDLTELLRYELEDISTTISNRRYTIKELRRFVKIAIWHLQVTPYKNKYYADADGIIHPQAHSNQDRAIILMQAVIEVNKSQLTRAADTNILFRDGRGSFNNRTHQALRDNFKDLIVERDKAIAHANREDVAPVIATMFSSGPSS